MIRRISLLAALLPASLAAQITTVKPPVQRPQLTALVVRDPSMYVFDRYKMNGQDFLMHYMDDFQGAAHSSEAFTGGIQGMGSDRLGNVYAAVYVGPSQPTYVMGMRKPIRFTGPLKRAMDVATDTQGRIYIVDADLGQVIRIDDLSGTNMVTFGSFGSGVGQLKYPSSIAVDRSGHIYVLDAGNRRIVRIDDMNGEGWRTYDGMAYGGMGLQVEGASSIAVDSKGRLYYAKPANEVVVRVDDISGANIVRYGGAAGPAGSGYLLVHPEDVAIDSNDRIYITDPQAGWIVRISDMTGAGRALLKNDASGEMWKRPSLIAVFNPRADRTIIR
ncbi:MAG TPA: NHL repeat-containing protein [Gemmatimonadaceae bacterium]